MINSVDEIRISGYRVTKIKLHYFFGAKRRDFRHSGLQIKITLSSNSGHSTNTAYTAISSNRH